MSNMMMANSETLFLHKHWTKEAVTSFSQYFIKVSENMQVHTYLYLLKVLVKAPAEGSGGGQESCHCGSTVLIQNALQKSEVQEDKYISTSIRPIFKRFTYKEINVEVEQNYCNNGSGAIQIYMTMCSLSENAVTFYIFHLSHFLCRHKTSTNFNFVRVLVSISECSISFFTSACCSATADELISGSSPSSSARRSVEASEGPCKAFSSSSWESRNH